LFDLAEVPRAQWKQSPKTLDAYVAEYRSGVCDRRHAMALAYINGGNRMNEIAKQFGVPIWCSLHNGEPSGK